MKFFLVFVGSGIGGVIRYGISMAFITNQSTKFPWATFVANIIAAFLVGLFFSVASNKQWLDKNYLLLLTTGLCGGLSTFSTFSYETLKLWQGQHQAMALVYVVASILTCLLFTWLGTKALQ